MAKKKKGGGGGGAAAGGGQEQEEQDSTPPAEEQENVEAATSGKEDGKAGKEKDKKAPPLVTAVLKVEMHCDGCVRRIRRSLRRFPGVEGVAMDVEKGAITVVGRFDPQKLRDRVASKTKKNVDLLANNNKAGTGAGNQKGNDDEHQKEGKGQDDGGSAAGKGKGGKDNKKPTVPVIVTVVLKIGSVGLHCDGCMRRVRTKLFKIKGVEQVRMEVAKNQVTVTGTMDVKALPAKLGKKLGRPVDVVSPPANSNKQQQQQDAAKDQNKGGKEKEKPAPAAAEVEMWRCGGFFEQQQQPYELFLSDENPNACSIM